MSQPASCTAPVQNIVDRARPELDQYLARFYRQLGLYAVAKELGLPTEVILAQVQSTVDASTAATRERAKAA
jgi:hypothetical protein